MNGNNQDNQQQDPKSVQPEVIGELKKERIGKPFLVVELFLLFGVVMFALPFLNNMLNDENSELYKLLHGGNTVTNTVDPEENKDTYTNGGELNVLSSDTNMLFNQLIIKNVQLQNGMISCVMKAYTGTVDLDEKEYFLKLYATGEEEIGAIKLSGKYDSNDTPVTIDTYGISFNANLGYKGKVVDMAKSTYPSFDIKDQDAQGYGTVTCSKTTRTITYTFQNKYLVKILDEDYVKAIGLTADEYMNKLSLAQTKTKNLGEQVATLTEVDDGYKFVATFNLDSDYKLPTNVVDYDYYPVNTSADKIVYIEKGKGYDCK